MFRWLKRLFRKQTIHVEIFITDDMIRKFMSEDNKKGKK